jgi:tetratricopeptide (TPR) repeat protein
MPYRAALCFVVGTLFAATPKASPKTRYVSSQAYYHAMRAEIAIAQNDLPTATSELQLALVYDSDSPYLTLKLAWANLKIGALQKAEKLADRTIALDPQSSEAYLVKARAEIARGQNGPGEKALKRALEVEPSSIDAAVDLARLLQRAGRTKDALGVLEKAASQSPDAPEPLTEIAEMEIEQKRIAPAAKALERALKRDPRNVQIAIALSAMYERQGRYEDAAKRWRDLVELVPSDPDALYYLARSELWVDHEEDADRAIEAIQSMVRGADVDEKLGMLYASEGRQEKALPFLEDALRVKPSDQHVRFAYAVALADLGKDEAALAELEKIGPDHELYVEARVRIGQTLLFEGRFDRALAAVRSALEHSPEAPPLVGFLAEALARSGHMDDALRTVREARKAHAQDKEGEAELDLTEIEAQLATRSGDRDRGIRLLKSAVDAGGGEDALYRLAGLYERIQDFESAQEIMQKLLKDAPDSSRALNFIGYMWAERSVHIDESVRLLRRAVELEPRSAAILDSLGLALHRQQKLEEAERYLVRASHLTANDPEIAEHLADVLAARGKKDAARNAYEKCLATLERARRARDPDIDKNRARVEKKKADLARKKS